MNLLDVKLEKTDIGVVTLREYLVKLLYTLWDEGEDFSGKRPFGNSGWEYEIYLGLIKAGLVYGELDDDGYLIAVDDIKADELVFQAIRSLNGVVEV